jgi:quercetin dioxygenase-like cupin family protein
MKISTLTSAPKVQFNLEGYIMHTSDSLEVIHLCLQPGQAIPQHTNQFDVIACLVEGEVTLLTGDKQVKLNVHNVAEIEKGAERGFTNTGILEARLLILKKF